MRLGSCIIPHSSSSSSSSSRCCFPPAVQRPPAPPAAAAVAALAPPCSAAAASAASTRRQAMPCSSSSSRCWTDRGTTPGPSRPGRTRGSGRRLQRQLGQHCTCAASSASSSQPISSSGASSSQAASSSCVVTPTGWHPLDLPSIWKVRLCPVPCALCTTLCPQQRRSTLCTSSACRAFHLTQTSAWG